MEYVNNTPHPVVVFAGDGSELVSIAPSGVCYRLGEAAYPMYSEAVPLSEVRLGCVSPILPEMDHGVIHIVSMPLLMGMRAAGIDRPDFMYPYGQVRDGNGRILGCKGLARLV